MIDFQLDDIFISDYDFIGDDTPIAVPSGLPNDYRRKIIAAYKSVKFGYKSVDRTYEKLEPTFDKLLPLDKSPIDSLNEDNALVRDIFDFLHSEHRMIYSIFTSIDSTEFVFGKHISFMALTRLRESYRACMTLIRMGFYFESYSVIRLIFEQLCWVLANYSHSDDIDIDKFIQPTKSISYAKKKFKNVGSFYYSLSHLAHISNNTIGLYISNNEDNFTLTFSKVEFVLETQIALYSLFKMQIETIKLIYGNDIKDFNYFTFDDVGINILDIRQRFQKFENRIKKYDLKINYGS